MYDMPLLRKGGRSGRLLGAQGLERVRGPLQREDKRLLPPHPTPPHRHVCTWHSAHWALVGLGGDTCHIRAHSSSRPQGLCEAASTARGPRAATCRAADPTVIKVSRVDGVPCGAAGQHHGQSRCRPLGFWNTPMPFSVGHYPSLRATCYGPRWWTTCRHAASDIRPQWSALASPARRPLKHRRHGPRTRPDARRHPEQPAPFRDPQAGRSFASSFPLSAGSIRDTETRQEHSLW